MINNQPHNWLLILDKLEEDSSLFQLVKRCPLEIMRHWNINYFPQKTIIFEQNKIYDEFNIVIEGKASVYVQSRDDKKYQQAQYQCGDIIGELEVFEQKPYVCSIAAETDLTLLNIPRTHFLKWLELDSYFNRQLLLKFSQQYYLLAKKAAEDCLYSLYQRICYFLLNESIITQNNHITINKQNLSEQFAVTLRSINRVFQQLKELHIIEIEGDSILILDKALLKNQTLS